MTKKGRIRQVPTFSEFTSKGEKILQVYYYLLGQSRPGDIKDFTNRLGEIQKVDVVRTFKQDTGKLTEICNYNGKKGILNISVNGYKKAITELVDTWIEVKTKTGEKKKIRLLKRVEGGDKWTEFYIRPFDWNQFFFQWIPQETLKDLSLQDNNYLVLVYAHMLFLKYSKGENWCLPHTTCALHICQFAFKVKRANRNKEEKIQECFSILRDKGLIEYDIIQKTENNGRTKQYYRITKVNDYIKQFPTVEELGNEPTTFLNKTGDVQKGTVKEAIQEMEEFDF